MTETSEQVDQPEDFDDLEFVHSMWIERDAGLPTGDNVAEMLLSEKFDRQVAEGIAKTDDISDTTKLVLSKEHGFVGHFQPFTIDRSISLTPLFEGDEESINLGTQRDTFLGDNPDQSGLLAVVFHTHPISSNIKLNRLMEAVFGPRQSASTPAKGSEDLDRFSISDLTNFKRRALEENPSLIYALGVRDKEDRSKGKLILISSGRWESLMGFDPNATFHKTMEYKREGKDHLEAYKEFGLNVVSLDVNLASTPHLDSKQIAKASQVLTTRAND